MAKDNYNRQPVDSNEQGCASKTRRNADNQPLEEVTGTISFRIAVFYDGTGNNKLNTDARRAVQREESEKAHIVGSKEKKIQRQVPEELEEAYSYLPPEELKRRFENAKKIYSKKKVEYEESKSPVSYLGSETNVYKMFRNLEKSTDPEPTPMDKKNQGLTDWKIFKKFYIEGIGTFGGQDDSSIFQGKLGGALAIGDSGIIKRSLQAQAHVVYFILKKIREFKHNITRHNKNKVLKSITIKNIWLDFFGFSRGSACARFSCKLFLDDIVNIYPKFNKITGEQSTSIEFKSKSLQNELYQRIRQGILDIPNIIINTVKVKNVGIFETVSSYGLTGTLEEKSNIEELFLHSIKSAEKVFHITARNEYRINFALTKSICGKSLNLPGAHSDIGGGYERVEKEDKRILSNLSQSEATNVAFWFKEMGYVNKVYLKDNIYHEISENGSDWFSGGTINDISSSFAVIIELQSSKITRNYTFDLKIHRPEILNSYSKIPLNYMLDQFDEKWGLKFCRSQKDTMISSEDNISELKSAIENRDEDKIKEFRLNYMHFSGHNYNSIGGTENYGLIEAYRQRENKHLGKFVKNRPFLRKIHEK